MFSGAPMAQAQLQGRIAAGALRRWLPFLCLFLALVASVPAFAQALNQAMTFPALTGHVVDQANLLPADTRQGLEQKLSALEEKSGIQFVVATVPSLQDQEIEPYSNELFRHWLLGEKAKNNGVLLLVAPKEKKVRIEVGYGLEGTLTDALSKVVIANAIAPRFKAGDFPGGVTRGVDDVITILTTDSNEWTRKPQVRVDDPDALLDSILPFLIVALVIFMIWNNRGGGGGTRGNRGGPFIILPGPGGFGGGGGGFGGGGGGFSGGGGWSGGGGASGGW
jgi:uncharacterized protein